MLDRLPAWGRYLVILVVITPVAAFVATVATVVITQHGVTDADWAAESTSAMDAAFVTAASGLLSWIAMYVTPLTRKFGVGSSMED